jgi:hypothetical protein
MLMVIKSRISAKFCLLPFILLQNGLFYKHTRAPPASHGMRALACGVHATYSANLAASA